MLLARLDERAASLRLDDCGELAWVLGVVWSGLDGFRASGFPWLDAGADGV
jgi:hypothetical protein